MVRGGPGGILRPCCSRSCIAVPPARVRLGGQDCQEEVGRGLGFYAGIPYSCSMEDRFDPAKDVANQEKHKLPLGFGEQIFDDDAHLILPSIRQEDGEDRFKAIGRVGEKLFTGVFVWRDDLPRFISVRRSNKGEERAYHSAC